MLKAERQNKILEKLYRDKRVISKELSAFFNVSEDTIRRDLTELDGKKQLKRVHSGALLIGPPQTDFQNREKVDPEIKKELGEFTAKLIEENSTIIIDTGTTNLHLVRSIPLDFKCTIITNSPPIAMALDKHQNIEVIMIGGILNKESMVNLGVQTIKELEFIHSDTYIMGIHNIDVEMGASVPTYEEAQIKRMMSQVSAKTIGMCTNEKIGTISNFISNSIEDVSTLVTYEANTEIIDKFSEKGIQVYNLTGK